MAGRLAFGGLALVAATALSGAASAQSPAPDGAALFKQRCAQCHDAGVGHAPSREALGLRSPINIKMTLLTGAMKPQGVGLADADIAAISTYLTSEAAAKAPKLTPNLCAASQVAPLSPTGEDWNGWSPDHANTRFQPKPGLSAQDVPRLKVKWSFAYPGAQTWGQPTVVGGRVFVADTIDTVYALDAKTGCTVWTLKFGAPVRSAISVGRGRDGHAMAYFGDMAGSMHAVQADSGKHLWEVKVDDHPLARMTGSPVLAGDRLLVPVSSLEEGAASQAAYECCTFRGAVLALDPATGKVLWKTKTITAPLKTYRRKGQDVDLHGPAGGSVWNAPTVDLKRGRLYFGVGNDYSDVDDTNTDGVMALDLKTGKKLWMRQLQAKDHWQAGCSYGTVCPEDAGPDYDFAASPILVDVAKGKQVLVAGQKSGTVFGLDPDSGKLLWKTPVGSGSIFGGIEWGMASAGRTVFAPISDSMTEPPATPKPGLAGIDAATGKRLWWAPAPAKPVCAWGEAGCLGAHSQAVSAMPGLVFSGSHDGHLRAYDVKTGKVVWDFDTGVEFKPVNGPSARGGSLDTGGPAIANGMVLVNSGYGQFLGQGGNVLLAFSVDGK
ncbi:MAG: outer membrane protein assembly factor BamB family protein [Caulobacteraceae bacterium]